MSKTKSGLQWAVRPEENMVALGQLARVIESEGASLRRAVERTDETEAWATKRRLEHLAAAVNLLLPPGQPY